MYIIVSTSYHVCKTCNMYTHMHTRTGDMYTATRIHGSWEQGTRTHTRRIMDTGTRTRAHTHTCTHGTHVHTYIHMTGIMYIVQVKDQIRIRDGSRTRTSVSTRKKAKRYTGTITRTSSSRRYSHGFQTYIRVKRRIQAGGGVRNQLPL